MTDNSFAAAVREREGGGKVAQLVKDGPPQDDAAKPDSYEAVRRIRSYYFSDVIFRSYRGSAQAFPWSYLRSWVIDETGRRMSLIWPEAVVILTGRNLGAFEEDVIRRIVAEFRQVRPGQGDGVPPSLPVIETMEVTAMGTTADTVI